MNICCECLREAREGYSIAKVVAGHSEWKYTCFDCLMLLPLRKVSTL